jgi:hypothetical protein
LNETGVATPEPAFPGSSLAVHSPQEPGSRVAEQRHGDAQALTHPEREPADPLPGDGLEADQAQDLVHPRHGDAVADGEPAQVVAGRPARVEGSRLQQRAHLAQRCR